MNSKTSLKYIFKRAKNVSFEIWLRVEISFAQISKVKNS